MTVILNNSLTEKRADKKYVPYTGAIKNVDLNSKNLTTTGTVQAEQLTSTDDATVAGTGTFNGSRAVEANGHIILLSGRKLIFDG